MTHLNIVDIDNFTRTLGKIHDRDDPTSYVVLGYTGTNDISVLASGEGPPLEAVASFVVGKDDQVIFAVVQLMVEGDAYNPVKNVFIKWIGLKVPAGLKKARAAGHSIELRERIEELAVAISSQYECAKAAELDYGTIAQSLSRMRPEYHSSKAAEDSRQKMSRSHAHAGDTSKSKLRIVDDGAAVDALHAVFKQDVDYAVFAYVVGSKDEVELVKTGSGGLDQLRDEWVPDDRIFFVVLRLQTDAEPTRDPITKYVLVTMIGKSVKPLQKARSSAQRQDIFDFAIEHCPIHGLFQPSNPADLDKRSILVKFK